MTCESLINRFLDDYLAGALSAPRRADFRVHLALCRPCRKYLASYRRTVTLAKASADALGPVPPQLIEAILAVARKEG